MHYFMEPHRNVSRGLTESRLFFMLSPTCDKHLPRKEYSYPPMYVCIYMRKRENYLSMLKKQIKPLINNNHAQLHVKETKETISPY